MPKPFETIPDTRGRVLQSLRLSLVDRCNFRCTYCMPSEIFGADYPFLGKKDWLTFDEIERVIRAFVHLGVSRIRLTGGEPLLRPQLPELVSKLCQIDGIRDLALTTNGSRLEEAGEALFQSGLRRITISLDSLDPEILENISGAKASVQKILNGIESAIKLGFEVKVNTVIMRDTNESQILPMARYCIGKNIPLRFIEFMDVGNHNDWTMDRVVTSREIQDVVTREFDIKPVNPLFHGEVARRYAVVNRPGSEIGFISSVTQPFCSSCNRGRISSDGKFFTCLFSQSGHDLRDIIRGSTSESQLIDAISKIWIARDDRYSEIRMQEKQKQLGKQKVEMGYIGG